jgi:NADH-quinone oxidoreductase subunit J
VTTSALLAQAGSSATSEVVLFVLFAGLAIGAGIAMVSMRNMVHGALMLVVNLLSLAGLYLVLQTAFLSIIQVIVYAGAIMVLFLFVIMLLGVDRDDLLVEVHVVSRIAAVVGALALVAFVGWGLVGPYTGEDSVCDPAATTPRTAATQPCVGMDDALAASEEGSVGVVANPLFTRWTFPFEAAALLLTVATLGAMLLGRRHETDPDDDPAWVPSMVLPDAAPAGVPDEPDADRDLRPGHGEDADVDATAATGSPADDRGDA